MSTETNVVSYDDIKRTFLDYFEENDHTIVPGAGIVPRNDPTLLVINSGMAPMKPYFTDEATPPANMLADAQLCVRTTDIDSIGDETHGTSFTMLGNWSFGAYGKERAIELAMGLVTDGYDLPQDKLLATTFRSDSSTPTIPSDDESYTAWLSHLPENRVIPSPPEDNFWGPAGTSGPCGPCTEIFYDRDPSGPLSETDGRIDLIDQRHAEIWNAGVFMEYEKTQSGLILPLGRLSVDAGAGLERFAMVLQGAASIHEIDQYLPAFDLIEATIGDVRSSRVIFDHIKTAKLMIESGLVPYKNGAGSVTRRLIRRVVGVLATNDVGLENLPDFYEAVAAVSERTPEQRLPDAEAFDVFRDETTTFEKTLARSLRHLDKTAAKGTLSGDDVFRAQTSQGIPLDLIKAYCKKHAILFPEDSYRELMDEHRRVSRAGNV